MAADAVLVVSDFTVWEPVVVVAACHQQEVATRNHVLAEAGVVLSTGTFNVL